MDRKQENKERREDFPSNRDQEGNDKAPGEETGKAEKVTNDDLKGKKVDRDTTSDEDEPLERGT
jgi:hypothetical protein